MKLSLLSAGSIALVLASSSALTACNGSDSQAQSVANDWVAPTSQPTAPVTGTGSDLKPDPTVTPSPIPTTTGLDVRALYDGPDEMEKYLSKFIADAAIQGVDAVAKMKNPKLQIQVASLAAYGSTTIGLCETAGNLRRVTFDPNFWNKVDETQRELVAHHELGHCVLYRAHRTDVLNTGLYASIMYPIIFSNSTYRNNYDYYQKELFTWSSTSSSSSSGRADSTEIPVATHVCN